jgi:hypothetical protein
MTNVNIYGNDAKARCMASEGLKLKAQEITTSHCIDGVLSIPAEDVSTWMPNLVEPHIFKDAYVCPPFVHQTYEIGLECPQGLSPKEVYENVNGETVTLCLGVITDATIDANAGESSGYLFYNCSSDS